MSQNNNGGTPSLSSYGANWNGPHRHARRSGTPGRIPGQYVVPTNLTTGGALLREWLTSATHCDRVKAFRRYFDLHASTDLMADFLSQEIVSFVLGVMDSRVLSLDMQELGMISDYVCLLLHERIQDIGSALDGQAEQEGENRRIRRRKI